jgi:hypothetical protein
MGSVQGEKRPVWGETCPTGNRSLDGVVKNGMGKCTNLYVYIRKDEGLVRATSSSGAMD